MCPITGIPRLIVRPLSPTVHTAIVERVAVAEGAMAIAVAEVVACAMAVVPEVEVAKGMSDRLLPPS